MILLSGKDVSKVYRARIKKDVQGFEQKYGKPPGLAVVMVGDDPASRVYVKNKEKACEQVGIYSARYDVDKKQNVEELESLINRLNADNDIHGILVQIPLPKPFEYEMVLEHMNPSKDADGLTYLNMGKLWAGQKTVAPCTPSGIMAMLEHYDIPVAGKKCVVVGRSQIVGKPMSQLLMDAQATVTVVHSKTPDIRAYTSDADLVVVAAGKPQLLGVDDFKEGAIVVDVGIHRQEDGTLCGDVRFDEVKDKVKAITPVPGGVGPMTITMLLENTLQLAKSIEKRKSK